MPSSSHATPAGSVTVGARAPARERGGVRRPSPCSPRPPPLVRHGAKPSGIARRGPCGVLPTLAADAGGTRDRAAHDARRGVVRADGLGAPGRLDARRRLASTSCPTQREGVGVRLAVRTRLFGIPRVHRADGGHRVGSTAPAGDPPRERGLRAWGRGRWHRSTGARRSPGARTSNSRAVGGRAGGAAATGR